MKSCVGVLKLKAKQAERLGLKSRSQISPLLEKCCLRLNTVRIRDLSVKLGQGDKELGGQGETAA